MRHCNTDEAKSPDGVGYDHSCQTCKHIGKTICEEPCMDCDIGLGNTKWELKMDKKKAAQILTDELNHCRIHLNDKDMAPEYYAEMTDLCLAYEFALDILEKEAKDA